MTSFSLYRQCVALGAEKVGDAWSLLIMREAGIGTSRFDEFQKILGIAPNILTRRLTDLTHAGLLEKRRYSDRPARFEYHLTPCGRDFLPVLEGLGAWAQTHFVAPEREEAAESSGQLAKKPSTTHSFRAPVLINGGNGAPVEPVLVDRATGQMLGEVRLRFVISDDVE